MGEVLDEKVAVFEVAQQSQAHNDGQQHPRTALPLLLCLRESTRCEPVHHGRQPEQNHERRIPGRIEDVTGNQEVDLLHAPGKRHRVEQENNGKENNKDQELKTMPTS
ncbi:hypothetical protein [Tunturiibacter gelidiferens]|uniref:hypothetical protein n=1 Tax=Tunturiibacter gelidiferens TaxID=3069689 RepID=UPI003D9BD6C0